MSTGTIVTKGSNMFGENTFGEFGGAIYIADGASVFINGAGDASLVARNNFARKGVGWPAVKNGNEESPSLIYLEPTLQSNSAADEGTCIFPM